VFEDTMEPILGYLVVSQDSIGVCDL